MSIVAASRHLRRELDIVEQLRVHGLVAVIRSDNLEQARRIASKAVAAGAKAIEITYTVPDAGELISELSDTDCIVGAGSIFTRTQLSDAVNSGARFVVSAANPPWLVHEASKNGILAVPGCATPQDVWRALEDGARVVKLFPITRLGGPTYVRDLRGPFAGLDVMASGGVRASQLADYLQAGTWCIGVNGQSFQ